MKKAFEIWIDDDCELTGFCGTVIVTDTNNNRGVTCSNFNENDLKGKSGYFFPAKGNGTWLVKQPEHIVIDNRDLPSEDDLIPFSSIIDISVRLYNVLVRAGFTYVNEMALVRDADIKLLRNLGDRAFEELCEIMKRYDISFGDRNVVLDYVSSFKVGDIVEFEGERYTIDNFEMASSKYRLFPRVVLNHMPLCYKTLYNASDILNLHKVGGTL